MFVLLLETLRQQLDVLIQAVERYEIMIGANILLTSSVAATAALLPFVGALAFPAIGALALWTSDYLIIRRLRSQGFSYPIDWLSFGKVFRSVLIAVIAGIAIDAMTGNWVLSGTACVFAYFSCLAWICRSDIEEFRSFLPRSSQVSQASAPPSHT